MTDEKVLSVNNLVINFTTDNGLVQAVRDVSFDLHRGETLCIVGESGSGKSVTSKTIMGILANNAIVANGNIIYRGENLLEVSEEEFHKIRGHKIGMIFQDPLSSLNPIVKIGKQITEATLINSDKLKLMYNDLISDELIAYKNTIAKKNIQINLENKLFATFKVECRKSIDELVDKKAELKYQLKKETNNQAKDVLNKSIKEVDEAIKNCKVTIKQELAKRKLEVKKQIAQIDQEFTEKAKPLKIKLDEVKAKAKVKVKEYKASIEKEYSDEVAKLKQLLANAKNEEETKAIQAKLDEANLKMINKLKITKSEAKKRALDIMREVGIPEPERRFNQYPFEFSGGMRQRIVIAIALTETPEILICDEPTTALDVTIQAQILELINKIKKERRLSCIFITHDLGVVANMADRVAVMYAGKIVEYGKTEEVFYDPRHPYTWALLSSIPDVDSKEKLDAIPGTPPNMIYPPKGDAFAERSRYAMKVDFEHQPPFFKITDTHFAATWLLDPRAPKVEMPKIVSERIKNALKEEK